MDLLKRGEEKETTRIEEVREAPLILFFDEINTNSNVSGILTEIIMEHSLDGELLPRYVHPVAAANPYKLRKKEGGLTQGLKLTELKSSKLVYLVEPLPPSMFTQVWNFGELNLHDEFVYIRKHVEKECVQYEALRPLLLDISDCLSFATHFVKTESDTSSVSLRTLTRFSRVLHFFTKKEAISPSRAVVLAIYFAYLSSLQLQSTREHFMKLSSEIFKRFGQDFNQVVLEELDALTSGMHLEPGVALNLPLKQNIFHLYVALLNEIPIILTGPPGSSKTLSVRILYRNLRGPKSPSERLR